MSEDPERRFRNAFGEGRDLVAEARKSPRTLFRDAEIAAACAAFKRGRSVLLVGPDGVGKQAVALGVARQLAAQNEGLRAFSTTQIMSGTIYLGDWQSKLTKILEEAKQRKTVVAFTDVSNVATTGASNRSDTTFLDALEPWLSGGNVRLLAVVTPGQLQALERRPEFAQYFDRVAVEPMEPEQIKTILHRAAERQKIKLNKEAEDRLFELCDAYLPATRGPGPMLEMLNRVDDFREQQRVEAEKADQTVAPRPMAELIEGAFGLYTGLPHFVVAKGATMPARDIRDWFRARVIGQEEAIDAVVEVITLFKARMHDRKRPIGTALFVGPTGVGKTELARALATFFFGSDKRLLRFDMSEFAQPHAYETLIGSPHAPERGARLLDPVRAMPFQVVLFDEIEKASVNVLDLLLQLLDEGRLTAPTGETVDFRNTIMIATSNVGAMEGSSTPIGFGADSDQAYDEGRARQAIEQGFRPEFLNRFQHITLFHPLNRSQARRIAEMELQAVLERDGVIDRNLIVDIEQAAIDHVISAGFDPRFGGRAIKREVKNRIVLPIATLLMERDVPPGSLVQVRLRGGRVRASVTDTPESREFKAEQSPVREPSGRKATRADVEVRIRAAQETAEALAQRVGTRALRDAIEAIDVERRDHRFWADAQAASRRLAAQTRKVETVSRLDRLRDWAEQLVNALDETDTRAALENLTGRLVGLENALRRAERELVAMPPEGYWDALLEIAPVGANGARPRDMLFRTYSAWAAERGMSVEMLHEPSGKSDPVLVAVRGAFAAGYLLGEMGLHRVRLEKGSAVARLRVAPVRGDDADELASPLTGGRAIAFAEQRALKGAGAYGGKLRSRVAVDGLDLVLQNAKPISDNRELAAELIDSWHFEPDAADQAVRRYDEQPFRVRDFALDTDFTHPDTLKPRPFQDLLEARVDALYGGAAETGETPPTA